MPDYFQLKIPVNKTTVVVLLLVVFAAGIGGTYIYQTYPSLRASIDLVRNLLVAALTIASILVTASSIRDGIHERRQASAFALIARFNNPNFYEPILAWTLIWKEIEGMPSEKMIATIEGRKPNPKDPWDADTDAAPEVMGPARDEKKRRVAVQMFNFFEEIAIAVETGGVDEKILQDYFNDIFKQYYTRALPWIEYCRRNKGTGIYVKLGVLIARWNPPPSEVKESGRRSS